MYDDFVAHVAKARKLDEARVRELAGGRVWMGGDAIARGLCDAFGGLTDAIAEARRLAGIAPGAEVGLVEYPPRRLLALPRFGPSLPGLSAAVGWAARGLGGTGTIEPAAGETGEAPDYAATVLRRIIATPARPLLLTPEEALPDAWRRP
jgi:ClpP class serine protease